MMEGDNEVLQCLSKGQNVILTCDIYGFPRLGIVFRRENVVIIPGGENFERITKISSDQVSWCSYCMQKVERNLSNQDLHPNWSRNRSHFGLVRELGFTVTVGMGASTPHKDPWESD